MLDGFGIFRSLRSPTHQSMVFPSMEGTNALREIGDLRHVQFIGFPLQHQLGPYVKLTLLSTEKGCTLASGSLDTI